mgnify:CR=1 FL=1
MSALWVLAPIGLVAACALAAWWSSTGRTIEDLFRPADPPEPLTAPSFGFRPVRDDWTWPEAPESWELTDADLDLLGLWATEPIMREYLTREDDES